MEITMEVRASELFKEFKEIALLEEIHGDTVFTELSSIEMCNKSSLVFCDYKNYLKFIESNQPTCVITNPTLLPSILKLGIPCVIVSSNVGVSHAKIKQKYKDHDFRAEWEKIHPSALIHETVILPNSIKIGPNCVIGKNVSFGERVILQANTVVEENAKIGNDVTILANCVIGHDCILQDRVYIKYGSIIGGEGFGFVPDSKKTYHRIPQTGIVVIEEDVVIGSNNCIDRAAYQETRIKRGTKFDNFVHIAHNVTIGEDVILTAGCIIAGSTVIGNRVIMSGQTGVLDHLKIADDVILVQRAGVMSDIKEAGVYAGIPPQPLSDYLKNSAVARKLTDLKSQVSNLEKTLKKFIDNKP
jgi:UDP-3-O-[3-hydroxymyristoyl] glucosamine N-acyltransferase